MEIKRNFFIGFFLIVFSLFSSTSFATISEYNQSLDDGHISRQTYLRMISYLGLNSTYFSGEEVDNRINQINTYMSNGSRTLRQMVFVRNYSNSNILYLYWGNSSDIGSSQHLFVRSSSGTVDGYSYTNTGFAYFNSWYMNGNTITGANVTWIQPALISGDTFYSTQGANTLRALFTTDSSSQFIYRFYSENCCVIKPTGLQPGYTNFSVYGEGTHGYLSNYQLSNGVEIALEPAPTPTETETPTPTPTISGSVDLTETNQLIEDVNDSVQEVNSSINNLIDQHSGDVDTIVGSLTAVPSGDDFPSISSGDILDALDIETITDPYENFWGSITTGLGNALTCDQVTSYDIDFLGETYTINADDWIIDYPPLIRNILTISCTIGIVLAELKYIRKRIIHVSSGDIDDFVENFTYDDISDLF